MMVEFITIAILCICLIVMWACWCKESHDDGVIIESLCDDISHYQDEIAKLQAENQKLRGDLLMKQADEFARDCGKE